MKVYISLIKGFRILINYLFQNDRMFFFFFNKTIHKMEKEANIQII